MSQYNLILHSSFNINMNVYRKINATTTSHWWFVGLHFQVQHNKSRLKSSFTQTQGTAHVLSLPDAVIDNAIQNQQLTPIKLRSKQ